MGFINGIFKASENITTTSKVIVQKGSKGDTGDKGDKGDKGDNGIGFDLTVDNHFHLNSKKITNLAPPVNNNDAVNKKYVTDVLKNKAATTYVNNELAKKLEASDLNVINNNLNLINNTLTVHQNNKAEKTYVDNELANINNTLNTHQNTLTAHEDELALKANISDIPVIGDNESKKIIRYRLHSEENGNIVKNSFQWSFGNGGSGQYVGIPIFPTSKVIRGGMQSNANGAAPAEIIIAITINGNETGHYIIKPTLEYVGISDFTANPLTISAGDFLGLKSKTSNGSVTNTIVVIELEYEE